MNCQTTNKVSKNRNIAKNSLFLNIRMVFTTIIGLYTSRIVLNTLGVNDFGIYSVVGGVVAMFRFLNTAMSASTQRYLTIELGRGNIERLKRVFSTSLIIHIIISIIIVLLSETIGLWFVYNKLNVPAVSFESALYVYHFSVLTSVLMIMSTPYSADLIAREKFKPYAYISFFESVLKLGVALLLLLDFPDKLKWYGILLFITQLIIRFIYTIYSNRNFEETKFRFIWNKDLLREMFFFAGWTLGGTFSVLSCVQGLNILLNLFFTPAVNAARAISIQVQNAMMSFSRTVQLAFNPQITKSYATNDFKFMHSLIYSSSTFSFYFIALLSLPIISSTDYIVTIWLGTVPDYTLIFIQLIFVIALVNSLSGPLTTAVQATGDLKKFQIWESCSLIMILPVSYILLKLGLMRPPGVFIVHLLFELITQIIRVFIVCPKIKMKKRNYFKNVLFKVSVFSILAFPIPLFISMSLPVGFIQTLLLCVISTVCVSMSILIVINKNERNKIKKLIIKKINKNG